MTVLHTQDGTDFSLVCDGCGMVVEHLGASLRTWTFAWSLFSRHGWIGASTTGGPHGCARCMALAGREAMSGEDLDRIPSVNGGCTLREIPGGLGSVTLVPAASRAPSAR